jgi:hypothetical protein
LEHDRKPSVSELAKLVAFSALYGYVLTS